jgi:hypothetical protein
VRMVLSKQIAQVAKPRVAQEPNDPEMELVYKEPNTVIEGEDVPLDTETCDAPLESETVEG